MARERGTTKEVTKEVFGERSEQEPPQVAPEEQRGQEARGLCVWLVLQTLVFSSRALTLYFLRKEEMIAEQGPELRPPPPSPS